CPYTTLFRTRAQEDQGDEGREAETADRQWFQALAPPPRQSLHAAPRADAGVSNRDAPRTAARDYDSRATTRGGTMGTEAKSAEVRSAEVRSAEVRSEIRDG